VTELPHDAPGRYVELRDTRLRVDERGPSDAPPLLYIHGGPGQGCFDFMAWQGDRLAKDLRVVGVDQRGALFSGPLPDDQVVTEDGLVDDFEALRDVLDIERWSILGHSFGARLALRYAVRHPATVSSAVFDCPPWDHGYGLPAMLELAVPLLEEIGETEAADRARAMIAARPTPSPDVWRQRFEIVNALGDRRNDLYLKDADRYGNPPFPSESLPEEIQAASARHSETVRASDGFSDSLLPLLSEVRQPALLIRGGTDPAASWPEVERFRVDVPHGRVEVFEESSHFPQLEEPERYAELVRSFVTG
jgi:proline iminopeptidase